MKKDVVGAVDNGGSTMLYKAGQTYQMNSKLEMEMATAWMNDGRADKAVAEKAKRQFTEKPPAYPSPEYTPFFEFKVADDMTVTSVKWDNYTEYLLGDGNASTPRPLDQMPAYSNLTETSEELNAPQFLNSFVTLDRKRVSELDDIGTNNAKKALKKKKEQEEPPSVDLADLLGRKEEGPQEGPTETGPPAGYEVNEERGAEIIKQMNEQKEQKKRDPKKRGNSHKVSPKKNKKDDC